MTCSHQKQSKATPKTKLVKLYFKYRQMCNEEGIRANSFDYWVKEEC